MTRPGLRLQLTLAYSFLFVVLLCGVALFAYRTLAGRLDDDLNQELDELATGLEGYVRFDAGGPRLADTGDDPEQARFVQRATRHFEIVDGNSGEVLARSQELSALQVNLPLPTLRALAVSGNFDEVEAEGTRLRFLTRRLEGPQQHPYLLRVGLSLGPGEAALHQFLLTLLVTIPAATVLAALAGWWMSGFALRPVHALRTAAHDITISRLDRRLPRTGTSDEVDLLAAEFNDVFGRLHDAVGRMRQFAAAISHELRTPLLVLRGEAEVALLHSKTGEDYRRVLASQLEEFDRLTRLVNQFLTLALADAGEIALSLEPVDLRQMLERLVEDLGPVAEDRGVALSLVPGESVAAPADPAWLERLVLNLLDNALKYTPRGGAVRVGASRDGGEAVLEVADTGMGLSVEDRARVFDRFYRSERSRAASLPGAGIGLALVRWIAEAHRGSVSVASEEGKGARFTVRLPLERQVGSEGNIRPGDPV